jgi:hypothetical protein
MIHKYLNLPNYELLSISDVVEEIQKNVAIEQEQHIVFIQETFLDLLQAFQKVTTNDSMFVGDFKRLWYSFMMDIAEESASEILPLSDRFMNLPNKVWIN